MFDISHLKYEQKLQLLDAAANVELKNLIRSKIDILTEQILTLDGYSDAQKFMLEHTVLVTNRNLLISLLTLLEATVQSIQKEQRNA